MDVKAAVLEKPGDPFVIQELEVGDVRSDEVLVKIVASGICHTDLTVRDGLLPVALPVVLGHEGSGVVECVGARVSKVRPGDRVALTFASCGRCAQCALGQPATCLEFLARNFACCRLDGSTSLARNGEKIYSHFLGQSSFATHAVVTEQSVVKLDGDVPFEVAAPLGCGVQTGAGTVLNLLRPPPGSSIAVFGAGAVGLSAVMAARIAGCSSIVVTDLNPARLTLAQELGATHIINAEESTVADAIVEVTEGGANYSLEMSGSPAALKQALVSTSVGGVTAVVGAPPLGTEVSLDVNIVLGGGRIIRGVVAGGSVPDVFIPQLVRFWQDGRFPVDALTERFDFHQINEAASRAEQGKAVKPVLLMP